MNQSAKLDDMVQIVKTNAIAAKMVALASPNQVIMKDYFFVRKNKKKKELNGGGGRTAAPQVFCLKRYFDVFYLLAGRCVCQQGFTGPRCDRPCPKGFYGVGCKQACLPCTSG